MGRVRACQVMVRRGRREGIHAQMMLAMGSVADQRLTGTALPGAHDASAFSKKFDPAMG